MNQGDVVVYMGRWQVHVPTSMKMCTGHARNYVAVLLGCVSKVYSCTLKSVKTLCVPLLDGIKWNIHA